MGTTIKNKKPFGFYVCSITFAFERAAYYAAKFLLALFIVEAVMTGGLGLTELESTNAQQNLVAFTYLAPLVGGLLSDRWLSPRLCVPVGMALMGLGYAVGGYADSLLMIYVMIALIAVGTGLFKGNISAINGRLFEDKDQLDSAFSLQYSFVNIGSFVGTTAIGFLYLMVFRNGDELGYRQSFLVCAAVMALGLVWWLFGTRFLGDVGKKPFKYGETKVEKVKDEVELPLTKDEKSRMAAIILVSLFSVVFWLFWYLAYLPVYYVLPEIVNWNMSSGFEIPLAWFDSLNAFMCIALGPIFGLLWFKLAKSKRGDLNMFVKTALGLVVLGLSYLALVGTEIFRGEELASIWWVILFGVLLSVGEMLFSPLGNSFVVKYAPAKYLSVMMGVWIFATFLAGKTYGTLYIFLKQFDFVAAYTAVALIAIFAGLLLLAVNKRLARLVVEHDDAAVVVEEPTVTNETLSE